MVIVLSFLTGFAIGILVTHLVVRNKKITDGIAAYTEQRSNVKQNRKERIITALKEKGVITNNDVEKLLNIADATATNYLQELEREGKIEQIGTQGRFVHYKIR